MQYGLQDPLLSLTRPTTTFICIASVCKCVSRTFDIHPSFKVGCILLSTTTVFWYLRDAICASKASKVRKEEVKLTQIYAFDRFISCHEKHGIQPPATRCTLAVDADLCCRPGWAVQSCWACMVSPDSMQPYASIECAFAISAWHRRRMSCGAATAAAICIGKA